MANRSREEYLRVLKEEPYKIGHMVGFTKLTPLHNEWMKKMLYGKEDMTLLAHRLSYKTTVVSVVLAMLIALRPGKQTLFMRKTDTDTVEIIAQVKKILENPEFKMVMELIQLKPLEITKSNSTEIDTTYNSSPRGTSQLLGVGTSGSLTGKHYDYIFTDDIVNLKDRTSPAERERVKMIYNELQNIRTHGGRIINTGTPWHKEDAISTMPNVEKYSCYDTGIMSEELIQQKRDSMPPSLFAANYELEHIAAEDALFKTAPQFFDNEELLRDGIAHVDAAYGGADFTAFTCGRYDEDTDTMYMYGLLWHKHVDDVSGFISRESERLMCAPIYVEDNADKGYLYKELSRYGAYAKKYNERETKVVKISSYLRKWWPRIKWLKGTDQEYITQILDYTEHADHDDAPDSAACVCRILDRITGNHVE